MRLIIFLGIGPAVAVLNEYSRMGLGLVWVPG